MTPLLAAVFLAAGIMVGTGYFATLRRSIDLYVQNLKYGVASPATAAARGASAPLVGPAGPGLGRDSGLGDAIPSPHSGQLVPLGLTLIRIGGAIVFFAVAVHFGAAPLLAAFIGFLAARAAALHTARRGA